MKRYRVLMTALIRNVAALMIVTSLFVGQSPVMSVRAAPSRVAYVYGSDPTITANKFNTMLTNRGVTVDLYSDAQAALATTTSPTGNATFTGTQTVSWSVSDADTPLANLRQDLQYSVDNGNTWMPVAVNLPGTLTSYALDTNLLPKSTQGKLRLWVTDGLNNSTADTTGSITVANHLPLAFMLAPTSNGFIPAGSQTLLQGQASDVDELSDLPDNNFLWTMDGSTTLGVGRSLQVVLPNGKHTITLTVLDRDGATGAASQTVFVNVYRLMLPVLRK